MRNTLALITAALALGACARAPVAALELSGVPAAATTLEVWTWVEQQVSQEPARFPIDAPRDRQRLNLRLPQDASLLGQQVLVGVGAFDKDGCLRGLAEARGIIAGRDDVYLNAALSPVDGPCGAARPVITSVTPAEKRTMTEEPMTIRGLGFRPGLLTRVGRDDVPTVTAVSPTRMAGALPATPGRVGPKDVAVIAPGGAVLATRPAALRLLLTNLLFQAADFKVNRGVVGTTSGWVTPVPGADGTAGLLIANQFYNGTANSGPAVLLQELGLGRPGLPIYLEPNGMGAPKFVTALDLDGDGVRSEVVFLMNEGLDGKGGEAGPASLATYRVESTKLTRLDYRQISATALFGAPGKVAQRDGVVRPPQGGTQRETLLISLGDTVYEYKMEGDSFRLNPFIMLSMDAAAQARRPISLAALQPGSPLGLLFSGYLFASLGQPFKIIPGSMSNCNDSAIGDFDGDGVPDIACTLGAMINTSLNRTRPGATTVAITETTQLPCGSVASALATADLDGDGRDELVCGARNNQAGGNATLFLYQYKGAWVPVALNLALPPEIAGYGVAIADFDGDGRLDLATTKADAIARIAFNLSE